MKFSLSIVFLISLILLSSFLASSLDKLSGIKPLIGNFWVLGSKTSKALACFFPCFSNALPSGEYAKLACSIILL